MPSVLRFVGTRHLDEIELTARSPLAVSTVLYRGVGAWRIPVGRIRAASVGANALLWRKVRARTRAPGAQERQTGGRAITQQHSGSIRTSARDRRPGPGCSHA